GKDPPRKRETDRFWQVGESKIAVFDQMFRRQARPGLWCQLLCMAAQHQRARGIGAPVMPGVKPGHQHMAKPQAAAADIEEMVMPLQPLIKDYLHLMQGGLLPPAADDVAVFAARQRILVKT